MESRSMDLSEKPKAKAWPVVLAYLLGIVVLAFAIYWFFLRKSNEPEGFSARDAAPAALQTIAMDGYALELAWSSEWKEVQREPRKLVLEYLGSTPSISVLIYLESEPPGLDVQARAHRFLETDKRNTYPKAELMVERFRWLDGARTIPVVELRFGSAVGQAGLNAEPLHHRFWIGIDGDALVASYSLPPQTEGTAQDALQSMLSSLRVKSSSSARSGN